MYSSIKILCLTIIVIQFVSIISSPINKPYSMVMVGGGLLDDNEEIWNKIIELGGGKGIAKFGVISSASDDPCCDKDSSWIAYRDLLTLYGAAEVTFIPLTIDSRINNSNPEVINNINSRTGFFFGGGDQTRIIASFYNGDDNSQFLTKPSLALLAIKDTLLRTGGVVAGTSAGTDVQTSSIMITGGKSYQGLKQGTEVIWNPFDTSKNPNTLTAYGFGGIGLFPYGILDTHFANRGRQGRLIELLFDSHDLPTSHINSFCIDENTALVVTGKWNNRIGTVIGQRGVLVLDTSYASLSNVNSSKYGIMASRMSQNDQINMKTLKFTPASFKTNMIDRVLDDEVLASSDIFNEGNFEFDMITNSLFKSKATTTYGVTIEKNNQFQVTIGKNWNEVLTDVHHDTIDTVAVGYDGINPETGLYAYSYHGMWCSITTV